MGTKGKYEPLTDFLINCDKDEITLSFNEISKIVNGLPDSSHYRPEIWSNSHGGSTSKSYLNAGYIVIKKVLPQYITFKRSLDISLPKKRTQLLKTSDFSPLLNIDTAVNYIRKYHQTSIDGEFTRFRSWIHCYKAFKEYRHDPANTDLLCLHLAWYMASWGMLRGKSFLLQMDYLVHKPLVIAILSGKYESLFINCFSSKSSQLTLELSNEIKIAYGRKSYTQTFLTKIILGIFGTTPAFDRLYVYAAKKYKIGNGTWGANSLKLLWMYYEKYQQIFDSLINELVIDGIKYTPMKLLDMCLWQIGFDELGEKEM